jgi:hypothetical protein
MSRRQFVASGRRRVVLSGSFGCLAGAFLLAASVAGAPTAATGAVKMKPVTAAPGESCPGASRTAVDAAGRPLQCVTSAVGRIWAWGGAPSELALATVPASWAAVSADESGANAEAPVPALPGRYSNRAAMEARLVELANDARAAKGLRSLVVDPRLTRLTRWWAASAGQPAYAGRGTNHCPANLCAVRAAEIGYPSFGEVIRAWNPFPMGDMSDERFFVDSPRHMAILTNPKVTHIGFGVHIVGEAGAPQSVVVVGQVGRAR